jgi:hypothetical protein
MFLPFIACTLPYSLVPGNLHELLVGVLGVDGLELGCGRCHQHGGQLTNRLLQVR